MTTREFRIVLPIVTKTGKGHEFLRKVLANTFGGYTRTEGQGGWVNGKGELEEEAVYVYDVAAPVTSYRPFSLASELREISGEDCVYLRDQQDGEVHFI